MVRSTLSFPVFWYSSQMKNYFLDNWVLSSGWSIFQLMLIVYKGVFKVYSFWSLNSVSRIVIIDASLVFAAPDNRNILNNSTSYMTYFNVPMSFQMVNIPNGNGTNVLDKMIRIGECRGPCECGYKSGLQKLTELPIWFTRHPAAYDLPPLLCPTSWLNNYNSIWRFCQLLFIEGIMISDNGKWHTPVRILTKT